MFFKEKKRFYQFKYAQTRKGIHIINFFIDKHTINFHLLYYNQKEKSYSSKTLYSININPSSEDNLETIKDIYFHLTQKPSQLEEDILNEISDHQIDSNSTKIDYKEIFKGDIEKKHIKYFNTILPTFFPKKLAIKNQLFYLLFMSFLFELYHCETFQKASKYTIIKSNIIFKIFGTKLQYLIHKKLQSPHKIDLEKRWINTLFYRKNRTIIEHATNYDLLYSNEIELESILTKQRIKELNKKWDSDLITTSAKYFLSTFNIPKAFDLIVRNHTKYILSFMGLASLIVFLFPILGLSHENSFVIFVLPVIILLISLFFVLYQFIKYNLSLLPIFPYFKKDKLSYNISYISILFMPRLFFSILISWLALVTSFDMFYAHVHNNFSFHLGLNIFLITTIFLFFYAKVDYHKITKPLSILTVSSFISIIQGFFIIKFYLDSFISRTFTSEHWNNYHEINTTLLQHYPYQQTIIDNTEENISNYNLILNLPEKSDMFNQSITYLFNCFHGLSDFFTIDIYVLFSLFLLPVFFGLILQNIVDDKSIFKPLK